MSDLSNYVWGCVIIGLILILFVTSYWSTNSSRGTKKITFLGLLLNCLSPSMSILNSLHFKTFYSGCFPFTAFIIGSFIIYSFLVSYALSEFNVHLEEKKWVQYTSGFAYLGICFLIHLLWKPFSLIIYGPESECCWCKCLQECSFLQRFTAILNNLKTIGVLGILTTVSMAFDLVLSYLLFKESLDKYNFNYTTYFIFKMFNIVAIIIIISFSINKNGLYKL